ncbi:cell division protein FtsQ/DivIB [Paracoccaceae bacterium GXU_MW_L88]
MRAMKDPAPSRLAYKMQRLWLTPRFRRFLSYWLPMCVAVTAVAVIIAHPATRGAITEQFHAARDGIAARPEFQVTALEVTGANPRTTTQIEGQLGIDFPISSLDLDLPAMSEKLATIPMVSASELKVSGDKLQVVVTERRPEILWRGPEGLMLMDREGRQLGRIDSRNEAARLALISGAGAEREIDEALAIYRAAGPLVARVRGLVRIGERRWDVALDRGQVIRLPEENPVAALERILALHEAEDVLRRDVAVIDMRVGERPVLKLGNGALEELARVNAEGEKI